MWWWHHCKTGKLNVMLAPLQDREIKCDVGTTARQGNEMWCWHHCKTGKWNVMLAPLQDMAYTLPNFANLQLCCDHSIKSGDWWDRVWTLLPVCLLVLDSSWNVTAHGDARERKWRGNWRMEWVASTLHTTSEHGLSSITTADAHTSAASSRLKWRPPPI